MHLKKKMGENKKREKLYSGAETVQSTCFFNCLQNANQLSTTQSWEGHYRLSRPIMIRVLFKEAESFYSWLILGCRTNPVTFQTLTPRGDPVQACLSPQYLKHPSFSEYRESDSSQVMASPQPVVLFGQKWAVLWGTITPCPPIPVWKG